MELTVQPVLGDVLRIGSLSGTTVVLVLNGGLNVQTAADPQDPFLVHIQVVVVCQIVLNTAVSFVWTFRMNLFHNLCYLLVFLLSGTLFATEPAVVCRSGYAKQVAG